MAKQYRDQKLLNYIGENILKLRLKKGLSQESLAEISQLDTRQIGRLERGETNSTISILKRIADALEVDICDILK